MLQHLCIKKCHWIKGVHCKAAKGSVQQILFWNVHLWCIGKGWETMSAYGGNCEIVEYSMSDPIKYNAVLLVNGSLADAILTRMTIKSVKEMALKNKKIQYCPDWSASNKPGHPKRVTSC